MLHCVAGEMHRRGDANVNLIPSSSSSSLGGRRHCLLLLLRETAAPLSTSEVKDIDLWQVSSLYNGNAAEGDYRSCACG